MRLPLFFLVSVWSGCKRDDASNDQDSDDALTDAPLSFRSVTTVILTMQNGIVDNDDFITDVKPYLRPQTAPLRLTLSTWQPYAIALSDKFARLEHAPLAGYAGQSTFGKTNETFSLLPTMGSWDADLYVYESTGYTGQYVGSIGISPVSNFSKVVPVFAIAPSPSSAQYFLTPGADTLPCSPSNYKPNIDLSSWRLGDVNIAINGVVASAGGNVSIATWPNVGFDSASWEAFWLQVYAVGLTELEFDGRGRRYSKICPSQVISNLPVISFIIGGEEFQISQEDYLFKGTMEDPSGQGCTFRVQETGRRSVGAPFLRSHVAIFDQPNNRIGLCRV